MFLCLCSLVQSRWPELAPRAMAPGQHLRFYVVLLLARSPSVFLPQIIFVIAWVICAMASEHWWRVMARVLVVCKFVYAMQSHVSFPYSHLRCCSFHPRSCSPHSSRFCSRQRPSQLRADAMALR